MLSVKQATKIVNRNLPNSKVQAIVEYRDLYLIQAFRDTPGEETVDPFYSVNKQTGEFKEFSIITDGDISEITALFVKAKKER